MPQLLQLRTKLFSDIEAHYRLADASKARDARDEISSTVDAIFTALGGCEKCFGRGYLIANDIGQLCDCERAARLKEFIANYA